MEQQHIWDLIKTKQQTNIDIVTQIIKANPTIMSGDREFYTIMEWYENDLNRFFKNYMSNNYYIKEKDIFYIPSRLIEQERDNTIKITFTNCNIFDLTGIKTLYHHSMITFCNCEILSISPLENYIIPNIHYESKTHDYSLLKTLSKSSRYLTIYGLQIQNCWDLTRSNQFAECLDIDLNVKGNEIRMERGYYTDALYIKRVIDERA